MARIPMGQFGGAVPDAAPMRQPAAGAFGGGVAQALEQVGNTGMQIAGQQMRQEAMDAKQAQRDADAELKQELRYAEAMRKEANKAKAVVAMNGAKDALADLHDEVNQGVASGTIDKTKAEADFADRSKKVIEQAGKDLPGDHRELVLAQLGSGANRLANGVRKTVTQRDRQDVTAGIGQTLEYLQRQYAKDPAGATAQAEQTIDQLGPFSTLTPDQLAKAKQGFKEGSQYVTGYEMVTNGRESRTALAAAEKAITVGLPDLDPQKRAGLLDRVQTYRMHLDQKSEMAAQRAQREQERYLKQAEAQFNVFQSMADKGTVLDPAYIDRTLKLTAGTPYAAGVTALAQQAKNNGGLASQSLPTQQATLDAVNAQIAQTGRTPELDKRKDQVEKVLRGSQQDFRSDPMRAGLERGVITDWKPLDMSRGVPGLVRRR